MEHSATRDTILVINCGSSSLKFALYQTGNQSPLITGLAESLGSADARISIERNNAKQRYDLPDAQHERAIKRIIEELESLFSLSTRLLVVGHRVVHGGEAFSEAQVVDNEVLDAIKKCSALAPLHNPANIKGIALLSNAYQGVPQVAVFDTAFHQTMPSYAYRYALPSELYLEHGVRRYGFHGTSHHYVAQRTAEFIGKPLSECSFITAHLGNGASVCAIEDGQSVDTSMGMTPLEGLVMGTRSGDIDPGIFAFLLRLGYSGDEIDTMLNKKSGLLGVSQRSNDMRSLTEAAEQGDEHARLAIQIFCFRLAKYIAAMFVSLSKVDGLIFTGGIGENAADVRHQTVLQLKQLGFSVDDENNAAVSQNDHDITPIQADTSLPIFVSRTNEEWMIAAQSAALCQNT